MTENNQNYLKHSLPSHQALGDFAVPLVAELSLGEQFTEPDIMKELGSDQIKSAQIKVDSQKGYSYDAMLVEGIAYPLHSVLQTLPKTMERFIDNAEDVRTYNILQVYHGLTQRGVLIAGGDDNYGIGIGRSGDREKYMLFFHNPEIDPELIRNIFNEPVNLHGVNSLEEVSISETTDKLINEQEVREFLDTLFEQPEYEVFRKAADEHRAKAIERAKAKPHGRFR